MIYEPTERMRSGAQYSVPTDVVLASLLAGTPADVLLADAEHYGGRDAVLAALESASDELRASRERRQAIREHAIRMLDVKRTLQHGWRLRRVQDISSEAFYEDHYRAHRPVAICPALELSKWRSTWNFERIKERYGAFDVDIMTHRTRGVQDYLETKKRRATVNLANFIDTIRQVDTNNAYLLAFVGDKEHPLHDLFVGFDPFPQIVDDAENHSSVFLGPKGAITDFHYDKGSVLFVQLIGRKRIVLVPPYDEPLMYQTGMLSSPVDYAQPQFESYPLYRHANAQEVTVNPGEAVFLPPAWWHAVENLEPSLSLSIQSFRAHRLFLESPF